SGCTLRANPLFYTGPFTATDGFSNTGSVTVGSAWQDAAGNAGVGGSDTVTIDTLNPNAPTVLRAEDNAGADTRNLTRVETTDDSKPVLRVGLTGTNAETGDSVRIFSGTS